MRAHKGVIVAMMSLLAATGCGSNPAAQTRAEDLLYLRTSSGVSLVRAGATTPTFSSPTAEPAPDWAAVVRAGYSGGPRSGGFPDREDLPSSLQTDLTAVDPVTDETLWQRSVSGRLRVKVVSPGARFVALAPDTGRYLARPDRTRLIVTGRDAASPTTVELDGNFEPEAFSVDGKQLFVVQYLPAARPTHYQVRRLDLETGEVQDVFSVDQELQEAMRGTARVQEMSPDGTRLYTLYSVDTPQGRRSFVHVLSLDELWAHCIDLPAGFAMRGAGTSAIGVAPDGEAVYVTDTAEGMVAELDPRALEVSRTASVDLSSAWKGAEVTVGRDGSFVYVASGAKLAELSAADLTQVNRWDLNDQITGIQRGAAGNIYVATDGEVVVIDTKIGAQTETFEPPGVGSIKALGPETRGLDRARTRLIGIKLAGARK